MSDEDDDDGCDLFDSEKEEDEEGDLDESTKPVSNCCFPGVGDLTFYLKKFVLRRIIMVALKYLEWNPERSASKNPE